MISLQVFASTHETHKEILANNLKRSPDIESGKVPFEPLWKSESAAIAYNRALDRATADVVVFTHADVYFPPGWFDRLRTQLEALTLRDPNWALCGVSGLTADDLHVGRIWDSGLFCVIGKPLAEPVRVITVDEVVLILRRASGLRFDTGLPGFHLYGADLVMTAEQNGQTVYGLDLPVLHNTKPVLRTPDGYVQCYKYMVRKWRARLPVSNLVVKLTSNPLHLLKRRAQFRYKAIFRKDSYNNVRLSDPRQKSIELGFE